jgi:23S rRNA (uracil1939-C5)-methyltransferase
VQLKIEKLIYGGDGLARIPGEGRQQAVFLPHVLPGEEVEAELHSRGKGFARARLVKIVEPSPARVEPRCPHFGRCGGCQYQHMDYPAQLSAKEAILRESLRRFAKYEGALPLEIHSAEPWGYRNRVRLQVRVAGGFRLGFYCANSHQLEAVHECPLLSPLLGRALTALWQAGEAGLFDAATAQLQLFANDAGDSLLAELYAVRGAKPAAFQPLSDFLAEKLPELSGLALFFGEAADEDEIAPKAPPQPSGSFGEAAIDYQTALAKFRVGAGAFFQTNRFLVDTMQRLVVEAPGQEEAKGSALDLYAGVGLFSLPLCSRYEDVTAVELSSYATDCLREREPKNLSVRQMATEEFLKRSHQRVYDRIVLDPPRAGLGEKTAQLLAGFETSRMTYVSCDPVTLARDLKILLESGFTIVQAHLLDLFPQTGHMETIVHLARG